MGQSWWDVDLTKNTTNAPQVGIAGALTTSFVVNSNAYVFYTDANQNVHQLSIAGASLSDLNLTGSATPCPPATAVPVASVNTGLSSFLTGIGNVVYQPPTFRETKPFPFISNPIHLLFGSLAWVDLTLGLGTGIFSAGYNGLSSLVDTDDGQHVFYINENGHVCQLTAAPYSSGCEPWAFQDVTGSTPSQGAQTWTAKSGQAIASFTDANGAYHVIAVGSDGIVILLSYDPTSSSWSGTPFEGTAQQVSPGSGVSGFVDPNGIFVFYIAEDNSVHVLHNANPDFNLTANTTSDPSNSPPPNAAQMSSLSSFSDEYGEHVVYIGADQHVHQFVNKLGSPDTTWNDQDLTKIATPFVESTVPQAAKMTALSSFANPNTSNSNIEWIFYIGDDQHVHLLTFAPPPQYPPPNIPLGTPPCPVPSTGEVGMQYNAPLTASGGTPPYQFTLSSGMLPPGLGITGANQITGTPSDAGTFTFVMTVTDSNNNTANSGGCFITIKPALAQLVCPAPAAQVGTPYTSTTTPTGGVPPYIFTQTGDLPSGLNFSSSSSSCKIQGPPTAEGVYNYSIKVTDGNGAIQVSNCQITVTGSFQVTAQQWEETQTGDTKGGWGSQHNPIFSWFLDGPMSGLKFVNANGTPVTSVESPPGSGTYTISGVMSGSELSIDPNSMPEGWQLCTATRTPISSFAVTAGSVTQIFVEPPAIVTD
jgi:hypothetical protein